MLQPRLLVLFSLLVGSFIASVPLMAAQASASLQWSPDRKTLYSANFWQGSVTRIDRGETGAAQARRELTLGKDIRRLALNPSAQTLLATDYLAGSVVIVDLANWSVLKTLEVGKRPFGAVYQAQHDRFWVALTEDAQLIAIEQGEIVARIDTAETPRGLALTEDGRLLVTHSMTGELSIYDVRSKQVLLLRTIKLAESDTDDEFESQGRPRLLDDIAISPDGEEAWLPHVLWNFDHEFQFGFVFVGQCFCLAQGVRFFQLFRLVGTDRDQRCFHLLVLPVVILLQQPLRRHCVDHHFLVQAQRNQAGNIIIVLGLIFRIIFPQIIFRGIQQLAALVEHLFQGAALFFHGHVCQRLVAKIFLQPLGELRRGDAVVADPGNRHLVVTAATADQPEAQCDKSQCQVPFHVSSFTR